MSEKPPAGAMQAELPARCTRSCQQIADSNAVPQSCHMFAPDPASTWCQVSPTAHLHIQFCQLLPGLPVSHVNIHMAPQQVNGGSRLAAGLGQCYLHTAAGTADTMAAATFCQIAAIGSRRLPRHDTCRPVSNRAGPTALQCLSQKALLLPRPLLLGYVAAVVLDLGTRQSQHPLTAYLEKQSV